jgi:hypothetical protein
MRRDHVVIVMHTTGTILPQHIVGPLTHKQAGRLGEVYRSWFPSSEVLSIRMVPPESVISAGLTRARDLGHGKGVA